MPIRKCSHQQQRRQQQQQRQQQPNVDNFRGARNLVEPSQGVFRPVALFRIRFSSAQLTCDAAITFLKTTFSPILSFSNFFLFALPQCARAVLYNFSRSNIPKIPLLLDIPHVAETRSWYFRVTAWNNHIQIW